MAARIKKGDQVIILTGRDKGKKGEVITVMPKKDRAIVKGINMVKRHQKQTQQKEGGIIAKELPIHISNLAHTDPKDGKPTRITFKIQEDGTKARIAKRSKEIIA